MLEAVLHAIEDGARDLAPKLRAERSTNGITTKRQGKIGLLMPPDTEIDDAMQAKFRKKQLSFMNKQSSVDRVRLHGVKNFVKRHDHGFEIRLEQFEGEIGGGF